jgi:Uma2 family endonuclease
MPQGKHSTIQTELSATLNLTFKPAKIARAFSEFRCTFGDRSIVPDIFVFTWPRIPRDQNGEISNAFAIAPDWTIEILSPDQSYTKVTKNIWHRLDLYCLNHETKMGWLIAPYELSPYEQAVFVYRPKQQPEVFDHLEQTLPVPIFAKDLTLSVGSVFGWLLK